jgi:hypothetical protein
VQAKVFPSSVEKGKKIKISKIQLFIAILFVKFNFNCQSSMGSAAALQVHNGGGGGRRERKKVEKEKKI